MAATQPPTAEAVNAVEGAVKGEVAGEIDASVRNDVRDAIEADLKEHGLRPIGVEGYDSGAWVLMDYSDFVVHIFLPEARGFYNLERLWKNAPRIPVQEVSRTEMDEPLLDRFLPPPILAPMRPGPCPFGARSPRLRGDHWQAAKRL